MSEFYWELVQHDGTRLEIPPGKDVETIKKRMQDGQPINTRSMVVPVNQIKFFRMTDRPFSTQPLLDAAAQAFNEPVLNDDGSIAVKWVKLHATQSKWEKFYAPSPGYKQLPSENGMAVVAFKKPIHEIDVSITPYCSDEEVLLLIKH